MSDLNDLYQTQGAASAPSAASPAVTSEKASPSHATGAEAPVLETPPGLPQEYIDANLKDQPMPTVMELTAIADAGPKPLNARLLPVGESMLNATDIPYRPGTEPRMVQDRIDQGPRIFVCRAQRDQFEQDIKDGKEPSAAPRPKGQTVAHPDTLKPGTFITGESRVYRPG